MGVYIPNLEIPTSCFDCPVSHPALGNLGAAILGCPLIGKTLSAPFCEEKRMDNCPLVPVPPHGRLIDADALRQTMYHEAFETDSPMQKWDSGCWIRYKMFERLEENAPTIIPAEEEN